MSGRSEGVFPRWVKWTGLLGALLMLLLGLYQLRSLVGDDLKRSTNRTLEESLREGRGREIVGRQIGDSLNTYTRKPRP